MAEIVIPIDTVIMRADILPNVPVCVL